MTDELTQKSQEAISAASDAAATVEKMRQSQLADVAKLAIEKASELASERVAQKIIEEGRLAIIVREQVEHVLAKGTEQEKAMILARVPFICQDIKDIRSLLSIIQETLSSYSLVKLIVFSFVGAILLGVLGVAGTVIVMVLSKPH